MKNKIKIIIIATVFFLSFGFAARASADYYVQGTMVSENLLSGASVTDITGFRVAGSAPANTTISISFSQNRIDFYSSDGTEGGWDAVADGTTNVDITGLNWSEGALFYKLKLETTDQAATPAVSEVELTYDGEAVPPAGNARYIQGVLVSTDLLSAGTAGTLTGSDYFGYTFSEKPYGTGISAQFSIDGTNWYSSDGTLWGADTLTFGDHLSPDTAISLSALNWFGQTSFYYKLTFSSTVDNKTTPVLKDAGLLEFSATMGGVGDTAPQPIAYYDFNEGIGGTAYNSGSGGATLNGTLNSGGSGTNSTSTAMWDKNGKFGGAMEFDGSNDYVQIADNSSLTPASNGGMTISGWIKKDYTNSTQAFYSQRENDSNRIDIFIGTGTASTYVTFMGNDLSFSEDANTGWQYYVFVFDDANNTVKAYKNGLEVLSGANNSPIQDINADAFIGSRQVGTVSYFDGLIDEPKIFNYALSADQVKREYNGGFAMMLGSLGGGTAPNSAGAEYCVPGDTTACAAPVGEWKMDEKVSGDSKTLYDTSGNGNNGTTHYGANATGMNCAVPGKFGTGCQFDGADDYIGLSSSLPSLNDFTISGWFYLSNDSSGNQPFLVKDIDNRILIRPSGYYLRFNGTTWADVTTGSNAGSWNYLTITRNGSVATYYKNNSKINQWDVSSSAIDFSSSLLGGWSTIYFKGSIDQVRIYNYARTPAQIAWEYNQGAPIAHWSMNETSGDTVHNEMSNTLHGTRQNMEDGDWVAGKYDNALDFDGSDEYVSIGSTMPSVGAVSLWIKPDSTSQSIIDLDGGSHKISISSGVVTATGFTSYYVDGILSGTVSDTNWHHITAVDTTAFTTTTSFGIGKINSAYFAGLIDEVKIFNYALTAEQVKQQFNNSFGIYFGE